MNEILYRLQHMSPNEIKLAVWIGGLLSGMLVLFASAIVLTAQARRLYDAQSDIQNGKRR